MSRRYSRYKKHMAGMREEEQLSPAELRKRKRRKLKKRRRRVLLAELMILSVLCIFVYGMKKMDLINYNPLQPDKLEDTLLTGPYTNIAMFGLDSRAGELEKGVRSDSIMIASINNETKEVKIVSVYRDTLLKRDDGTLGKANSAYAHGGPQAAVALLNRNLDLDIKHYVSVNFNSLVDIIDVLGGVDIEVTEEEVPYINQFGPETAQVVGQDWVALEHGGTQHLTGTQAVTYARIRSIGGDFQRTERQRLVLQKAAEKAQQANFRTLNKLMNKVLPQMSTNLTKREMLGKAAHILEYKLGETKGFPFEIGGTDRIAGDNASYVIPLGLEANVKQLHEFLFADGVYMPSERVTGISNEISSLSGIYP